jgi:glutaredoxin-like protein
MAMIQEKDRQEILNYFEELVHPVKIINFTQSFECQYCRETRQLLEEVAELSDKINIEVYDLLKDKAEADKYNIVKIPATIIMGEKDYGIRLYGIPSGYEFTSILQDILMVSKSDSGLSASSKQKLAAIKEPVHLQVFVTPTCPYCPQAVITAHQIAFENDKVTADMVEATEFPQLAQRYQVMGVPKTVINDTSSVDGAVPEEHFVDHILLSLQEGRKS